MGTPVQVNALADVSKVATSEAPGDEPISRRYSDAAPDHQNSTTVALLTIGVIVKSRPDASGNGCSESAGPPPPPPPHPGHDAKPTARESRSS
jgi:hypothetical protein